MLLFRTVDVQWTFSSLPTYPLRNMGRGKKEKGTGGGDKAVTDRQNYNPLEIYFANFIHIEHLHSLRLAELGREKC